jgi:hypothetical protein
LFPIKTTRRKTPYHASCTPLQVMMHRPPDPVERQAKALASGKKIPTDQGWDFV